VIPEIVIVVNGTLGMSQGKAVGQAVQAVCRAFGDVPFRSDQGVAYAEWIEAGTRTIVKIAKTEGIFERLCKEVPGYTMCDEGFTDVQEGDATVFLTGPFLHKDRPKLLDNKKLPLYSAPVTET
jgi:peptidyl-tRNA hydrolase